jgi:hypothetical protein
MSVCLPVRMYHLKFQFWLIIEQQQRTLYMKTYIRFYAQMDPVFKI